MRRIQRPTFLWAQLPVKPKPNVNIHKAAKALRAIETAIRRGDGPVKVDQLRDKAEAYFKPEKLWGWVVIQEDTRDSDPSNWKPLIDVDADDPLHPLDIDTSILGVCIVCYEASSKALCRKCRTNPKQRELWEDPATGEPLPWFKEMKRERDRHAQAYKRNKDRLEAEQSGYQRTGKRGRPKAVGIEEIPYDIMKGKL